MTQRRNGNYRFLHGPMDYAKDGDLDMQQKEEEM